MRNGNGEASATETDPALEATVEEIARSRQRLTAQLGAMKQEWSQLTDWQGYIRRRPWQFVAGAFLLGYLLGSRRS